MNPMFDEKEKEESYNARRFLSSLQIHIPFGVGSVILQLHSNEQVASAGGLR